MSLRKTVSGHSRLTHCIHLSSCIFLCLTTLSLVCVMCVPQELPSAPYLLEPLVDGYGDLQSHVVKMDLLTAIMKLFFKRPPEVYINQELIWIVAA